MAILRRVVDQARVIAASGLTREVAVVEIALLLSDAIAFRGPPAVLVVDPARERPGEFRVWRASQPIAEGLRMLIAAGVWPGPDDVPPLHELLAQGQDRNVFVTTLWYDGDPDPPAWVPLWRDRGIQHGLFLVARSARGEIAVALFARRPADPPFGAPEIALADAIAPILATLIDGGEGNAYSDKPEIGSLDAPVAFDRSGRLATLGHGALEHLAHIGGGGPEAVARGRAAVERAASALYRAAPAGAPAAPGGFERDYLTIWLNRLGAEDVVLPVAVTPFGAFDLRVSLAADVDGGVRALGTLRQRITLRHAAVRALTARDVPPREMEVALAIARGDSVTRAAERLGIAAETARTLYRRLADRFDATDRPVLLKRLAEEGAKAPAARP